MKKLYSLLFLLMSVSYLMMGAVGTVTVISRPSYVDISAATAQSAVLVNLTGYTDGVNVKYRLYNSSYYDYCWDAVSGTFITSASYSANPTAPGSPSTGTTFWIVYQAGTNVYTPASYRDRLDPYTANNNTLALPSATAISSSYTLTGTLLPSTSYLLSQKYVVLGFSGANLICASSSDLTTGTFSLVCPSNETIDKVEIRTLDNISITSVTGSYAATTNLGNINLVDPIDTNPPVAIVAPADGATDVPLNIVPTITFNEAIRNLDASEITNENISSIVTFKSGSSTGTDVPCTITIDAAKKVITITPSALLENSKLYYIGCGKVEDASGNNSSEILSTFTTIASTTPTITINAPVGGETFYAGQNVTITWTSANITNVNVEAWAPNNDVYGWIPMGTGVPATDGHLDFTIPADADYGTGYMVRVSDADDANYNSTSGAFTVYGVATSLTDLKTRFVANDIVKISSEIFVNCVATSKSLYAQDADAGINIYDSNTKLTTTYAQYDGITGITGKLTLYNGMLEIVPVADPGAPTSTGNSITPIALTTAQLNSDHEKYESMIVKIAGVTFADAGGTFASKASYNITDGAGTTVLYVQSYATTLISTAIPAKADATGICQEYSGTAELAPRYVEDISAYSSAKSITSFAFNGLTPAVNAIIDENAKTIAATVPAGTSLTALVPTIAVSADATVSPASGEAKDFTSAVTYTVTAQDGTTQAYTVTVSLASGIDNQTADVVKMRPVPATTGLTLDNVQAVKRIEIFNIAGLKVKEEIHDNQNNFTVDLDGIASGIYFIKFTTEKGTFIKKFVKK